MATDEEGDVIMSDAPGDDKSAGAAPEHSDAAYNGGEDPALASDEVAETQAEEMPLEERVRQAEAAKEAGNALLKTGQFAEAVEMYAEGIKLSELLLEKGPEDIAEDIQRRGTTVYTSLRLNSAQACLKQSDWATVIEHAEKVLLLDRENCKALYRRGVASLNMDTEGRVDQARLDFSKVAQIEPTNRDAREQLAKAKQRLKEIREEEKRRYSVGLAGGLYQEEHKRHERQRLRYEEQMKQKKEKGEDEISFEEWQKKEKEQEDTEKKKEKEEREKLEKEARTRDEQRRCDEENEFRARDGLEPLSLSAWREEQEKIRLQSKDRKTEVVTTDDLDLDEEERKMLEEQKKKGYYHGRLGTVLSNAAPTPQQVTAGGSSPSSVSAKAAGGSLWNKAGTWEEKDMTSWAKDHLERWLKNATASSQAVDLAGESVAVSAKVSRVKSLVGEAQRVVVRAGPKFTYDFQADLSFSVSVVSGTETPEKFSGTLRFDELNDAVPANELRIEHSWRDSAPPERLRPLVAEWVGKLLDSVRQQVSSFVAEYQAK